MRTRVRIYQGYTQVVAFDSRKINMSKMCEYVFRNGEKCKEETIQNSKYCILHVDFPEKKHSGEYKKIAKLKEDKVRENINNQNFYFKGAKLIDVAFSGMKIEVDVDFDEATIDGEVWFENEEGRHGYAWTDATKIGGVVTCQHTKFKIPQVQQKVCRVARITLENIGSKVAADYYFSREEEARRKVRKSESFKNFKHGSKISKLRAIVTLVEVFVEWLLADLTCKYGTKWKRTILLWVFVVLLLFPILYRTGNGVEGANSCCECIYFSIVTATTLGCGDYHPAHGIYQGLTGAEAIFGTFMWAIFIAIFARRYMR